MTNCPACNDRLDRSTTLIPGHEVLRCRRCRRFAAPVKGIAVEWIDGGPGLVDRLKAIIEESLRTAHFWAADEDDPIWSPL